MRPYSQLVGLAIISSCFTPDRPPPRFEGAAALAPTNQMQTLAAPSSDTLTSPDSLLIRYSVRNDGPTQVFSDFPDFYRIRVFTGDGAELRPRFEWAQTGSGGHQPSVLAYGETTPEHAINLACMEYDRLDFDVHFPTDSVRGPHSPCALSFQLPHRGYYFVTVQHVPVRPPASSDPEFLPSRADTLLFYFTGR